ncbi:MAG: hypothetical protein AAF297_09190 [Planctomycetota bacterium]
MTLGALGRMLGLAALTMFAGGACAETGAESPVGAAGSASGPGEHLLVVFEDTAHLGRSYAVVGQVRTERVAGTAEEPAMLETLNYFEGDAFFSRETTRTGGLRSLAGSAGWRSFLLPFSAGDSGAPDKVELRAVLPGDGTVEIRGVRLVESLDTARAEIAAMEGRPDAWWSPRTSGWIGGTGGAMFTLYVATIIVLARKRVDRKIVGGLAAGLVGLSGVLLVVGLIALAKGQPYAVWYVLLLFGFLGMLIPTINWFGIRKQYQAYELQKLRALDA